MKVVMKDKDENSLFFLNSVKWKFYMIFNYIELNLASIYLLINASPILCYHFTWLCKKPHQDIFHSHGENLKYAGSLLHYSFSAFFHTMYKSCHSFLQQVIYTYLSSPLWSEMDWLSEQKRYGLVLFNPLYNTRLLLKIHLSPI